MLALRSTRLSQAGAAQVDWANPITRGLAYAYNGTNSSALAVGTRKAYTAQGEATGFGSTLGIGSTDSVQLPINYNAPERTYFFQAMYLSAGGGNFGRIFDKRSSGVQTELLYTDSGAGVGVLQYNRALTGGNIAFVTGPVGTVPVGTPFTFALTYSDMTPTSLPSFYLNGVAIGAALWGSSSGTAVSNSEPYVLGNRKNDNLRNFDGWIGPFYIFDRILSAAEVASLSANPWQVFR